jgi:hypothetical protein
MTIATAARNLTRACAVAVLSACAAPPAIGGPCDVGVQGGDHTVTITRVALECEGRTCIETSGGPGVCTAECGGDEDCATVAGTAATLCRAGFTCGVAAQTGPYACRRFCVCRDDFDGPSVCPGPL